MLTRMLCAVQQACQRGELHASLKAFRQSVFKKVYKAQQEPKEQRKAAKTCKAGELFSSIMLGVRSLMHTVFGTARKYVT